MKCIQSALYIFHFSPPSPPPPPPPPCTIYHPPCSVGEQPLASRAWTACSCLITEEKAYGITVTCINQNSWWWRGECFDLNVDDVHHDEECEEQDQYSWHYQLDVLKYEKLRLETRSSPFFRDALNASSLILCFEGIKSFQFAETDCRWQMYILLSTCRFYCRWQMHRSSSTTGNSFSLQHSEWKVGAPGK